MCVHQTISRIFVLEPANTVSKSRAADTSDKGYIMDIPKLKLFPLFLCGLRILTPILYGT